MQNFSSFVHELKASFCSARLQSGIRSVCAGRKHANLKVGATYGRPYFPRTSDKNSSRVLGLSLNEPSIALVTV
jgi:hypothetical protein